MPIYLNVTKGMQSRTRKLDDQKVKVIRERLAKGDKIDDIAKEYGVHRMTIYAISIKKTWRD